MLELWWLAWALCVVLPSKGLRLGALIPGRKFCSCVWELTEPPVGSWRCRLFLWSQACCSDSILLCNGTRVLNVQVHVTPFQPQSFHPGTWPEKSLGQLYEPETLLNYCSKKLPFSMHIVHTLETIVLVFQILRHFNTCMALIFK